MALFGYLFCGICLMQLTGIQGSLNDELHLNRPEYTNAGFYPYDSARLTRRDSSDIPPPSTTSCRNGCDPNDITRMISKIIEEVGPHFVTQDGRVFFSKGPHVSRQWNHRIIGDQNSPEIENRNNDLDRYLGRRPVAINSRAIESNEEQGVANISTTTTPSTTTANPLLEQPLSNVNFLNLSAWDTSDQHMHNEKGEVLIHRPAPIVVNRPPTKVVVNHPPLIVKPAPVIFHRPPSVIVRPIILKQKENSISTSSNNNNMPPIYIKIIKPPTPEKVFIKEQIPCDEHKLRHDFTSKRRYYDNQFDY